MEIIADLAEKLMLAAWYAQYDFGVPRYGIDEGVVGCCVAGMQCDHHVSLLLRTAVIRNIAVEEMKAVISQILCNFIAKADHILFKVKPDDLLPLRTFI